MTGSYDASKAQICDCGLFTLAYATALCLGQNSQCLLFKQSTMRAHLLKCLEEDMKPFPCSTVKGHGLTVESSATATTR